jgi:hypothetical protein
MTHCPLYNGQNLDFTGKENPYGLIQKAGKSIKKTKMRKTMRKTKMRKTMRKTMRKNRKTMRKNRR